MIFASLIRQWKELSRFKALDRKMRAIVFYAEDNSSWNYFEPIVKELTETLGQQICYVTSSKDDSILALTDGTIRTFCIGSGTVRTAFFAALEADVMVMTMPDLGTYHIKRSRAPVHYVYVFHSMISTHMSYRPKAFDQFDSILCTGPHHVEEIRATEKVFGLKPKTLIEAGYTRLDSIIDSARTEESSTSDGQRVSKRIVLAPSWGEDSVLENHGEELIEILLGTEHDITVRPHMMVIRHREKLLERLQRKFGACPNFTLDLNPSSQGRMAQYDLLVADWGGSALEFAFGLERPVLFVDVPRKVFNPEYERLSCEPMEVQVRSEIGDVVSPDRLSDVPERISNLLRDPQQKQKQIRNARSNWTYNLSASGKVGAEYIKETALKLRDFDPHKDQDLAVSASELDN